MTAELQKEALVLAKGNAACLGVYDVYNFIHDQQGDHQAIEKGLR